MVIARFNLYGGEKKGGAIKELSVNPMLSY